MSTISGVRRGLSHADSLPVNVTDIPKYGVSTELESELGEVKLSFIITFHLPIIMTTVCHGFAYYLNGVI